jgi:hypothetical protein
MSKQSRQKQRIWLIIGFLVLGYAASKFDPNSVKPQISYEKAYEQQQSDMQLEVAATVKKILPDDTKGSRHQRFIIQVASGKTILVAHNIDLAPRVANIQVGDDITVYGEYEWNEKGGVIHWTHHDPANKHIGGWIRHNGSQYQ